MKTITIKVSDKNFVNVFRSLLNEKKFPDGFKGKVLFGFEE